MIDEFQWSFLFPSFFLFPVVTIFADGFVPVFPFSFSPPPLSCIVPPFVLGGLDSMAQVVFPFPSHDREENDDDTIPPPLPPLPLPSIYPRRTQDGFIELPPPTSPSFLLDVWLLKEVWGFSPTFYP